MAEATKKDIKELVKGVARFKFYRDGNLYYETEGGFQFPVPISDIGTATFNAEEKAIHLMRYIRKFVEVCEKEQTKSE